ncbi:MAG: type II toxin-antitoxin system Phd/YefM family antitoxin [Clostridiales bacterium]|nr:type II toxin-antitoxin system Phd/YefM family antitoxin [Clostridiales bacterium]
MIVSATEVRSSFGKYLDLAAGEDIIITRNGVAVARLTVLDGEDTEPGGTGERKARANLDPKTVKDETLTRR